MSCAQPARSHPRFLSAFAETSRPPVPQWGIKFPNLDAESLSLLIGKGSQADPFEGVNAVCETLQAVVQNLLPNRQRTSKAKKKPAAGDLGGMVIGGSS